VIIFNRELLVLLPKAWLKEALPELLARDASQDVIAIAKAKDENSGLAPSMVLTILDHPDRKLTLTEKSSKTILRHSRQSAWSALRANDHLHKALEYVSDFGFMGPFVVKMDCINYQLSAPLR